MEALDRIVVRVLALLLVALSALIAMTLWGDVLLVNWILTLQNRLFDGVILILILLLFSLYLIFVSVKPKTDERVVSHHTTLGMVNVSVATLTGLIMKAVQQFEGVKYVNVMINEVEPLKISIELQLLPDHNIPELSQSIQAKVTEYLRSTVGISAESINVLIKSIVNDHKQKLG